MSSFSKIADTFHMQINSQFVLCEKFGKYADEHDEEVKDIFTKSLQASLSKYFRIVHDKEEGNQNDETEKGSENQNEEVDDALIKEAVDHFFKHGPGNRIIANASKVVSFKGVNQGKTIRIGALITLVSYYESLLSKLIKKKYELFPQSFNAEKENLSLSLLYYFDSIDDAKNYVIGEFAKKIVDKNTEDQLLFFKDEFKINLNPIKDYQKSLIEIVKRRNIFVHNDGIVNTFYLKGVPPEFIEKVSIKLNDKLEIDNDYLLKAIETIFIVGSYLIFNCWCSWLPTEKKQFNTSLSNYIYDALKNEKFKSTINFGKIIEESKELQNALDDESIKLIVINHAIGLKKIGLEEDKEKLLNSYDWSSSDIKFRTALAILKNEKLELIISLINQCISINTFDVEELIEYPIFDFIREEEEFINLIESLLSDDNLIESEKKNK